MGRKNKIAISALILIIALLILFFCLDEIYIAIVDILFPM